MRICPNLTNYDEVREKFRWSDIEDELQSGRPVDELQRFNIGYFMIDRHCNLGRGDRQALRCRDSRGGTRVFTYLDLQQSANRFGNILRKFAVDKGDSVFLLLGRVPELYFSVVGALRAGCVVSPLFSAFGQEPIFNRMKQTKARVLVTTPELYTKKVLPIRERLKDLKLVLLVSESGVYTIPENCHDYSSEMSAASSEYRIADTTRNDLALMHFTSGTTGTPKGAMHVHGAALMHYMTGRYALDLHTDDIFWCTADPGWVTGTSYGIIAPLMHGVTSVVDEGDFDPERWYKILQDEKITVWYTAPTAIRMLMRAGAEIPKKFDLSNLRFIASVGEPLNPEAIHWGKRVLGLPIHDNWWQSETGGIMIANYPAMNIKPGSMGKPLPGVEAVIVDRESQDTIKILTEPGKTGELALKSGWPSMFRGYLNQEDRYKKCFVGELYLSGDLAMRDQDGYFWFVGRMDDVIKSAGHLVGPFEVESVLMEHPAVAEAGVIGKPDAIALETLKAFVSLKPGFEASDALRLEILGHARKRLGPVIAPKEIEFLANLPKTRSGKIMRRLLKARELGLPEGDLSSLETAL